MDSATTSANHYNVNNYCIRCGLAQYMLSLCVLFEPPDVLISHTLASQVKFQVNNIQVQVPSRIVYLNFKSCRKS